MSARFSTASVVALLMLAASSSIAQEMLVMGGAGRVARFNETTGASLGLLIAGPGSGFGFPNSMTFSPTGDLYTTAGNNTGHCIIRRYSKTGVDKGVVVDRPATGVGCETLHFGPDGKLYASTGIDGTIERFEPDGQSLGSFVTAGQGLFNIFDFVFGPDEHLYVTDRPGNRILRFDGQTGAFMGVFVSAGLGGLDTPYRLVFGLDGDLYVSSFNSVPTGMILRYGGTTGIFKGAFVSAADAQTLDLYRIYALTFGPDGKLYVGYLNGAGVTTVARFDGRSGAFIDKFPNPMTEFPGTIAFTQRPSMCFDGNVADSDGDGLLDCWENRGIDFDFDGTVDWKLEYDSNQNGVIEPSEKAAWFRKDIFVEIDFMERHQPDPSALNLVVSSFAAAPILNITGPIGIRLHLLVDEQVTHADAITFPPECTGPPVSGTPDFDAIKASQFGTNADRSSANRLKILGAKELVQHYALFAHSFLDAPGTTGCSELPGNDLIVTLGAFPGENGSIDHQAATFMHELGHNLGLWHGGFQDDPNASRRFQAFNCKPNYLSVMNYTFLYDHIWVDNRKLSYSDRELPTLDEFNLTQSEVSGIGGRAGDRTAYGPPFQQSGGFSAHRNVDASGSIDWSGDGVIGPINGIAPFGANVNWMPIMGGGCDGTGRILKGHDDWHNLVYDFRQSPDFADAVHQSAPEEVTYHDMLDASPDTDGDEVRNLIDNCVFVPNPDQADLNHNGVGDRCEVVTRCDANADGTIDQVDLGIIRAANGQAGGGPTDPRDGNGDGAINVADVRYCQLRLTPRNQ